MFNAEDIKLIIWDLDETFWKGILSEGPVEPIKRNINLIRELSDRGIVNSICSKNDYSTAVEKLTELGVNDLFVFKSIDWTPKGPRINNIIKDMGLRPVNCLFLDDNVVNLNEALYYSTGLMIAEPHEINRLADYCESHQITDASHKRLKQYKILEAKKRAKEEIGDNLSFLYSSNTQVMIHKDCIEHIDRLFELVHRTNQLNFTKNRCTIGEFTSILTNKDIQSGYVTVKDNFGDYGIVGFYAIEKGKLIHFLFSCRTIGQGVEQWVYSMLGCPQLEINGDVINSVSNIPAPDWINQKKKVDGYSQKVNDKKIIFKGACDLAIMASYLSSSKIVEEFTYVGKAGNSIEHHNHSVNYLSFPFLNNEQRETLLHDCVFNDPDMFETCLYDKDVSLVFLSTQIEPMLGIYQNKLNGLKIAFGDYINPLTDPNNWDGYIDGSFSCHNNHFSLEWLKDFSSKYTFIGRMTPNDYINQLDLLLEKLPLKTHICLLLGSEIPFLKEQLLGYENRHLYYKEINGLIKRYIKSHNRVHVVDFNDYIRSQNDFTNNINHYQRYIYYQAANDANKLIEKVTGQKLERKTKLYMAFTVVKQRIGRGLRHDSLIFDVFSKINNKLFHKKG